MKKRKKEKEEKREEKGKKKRFHSSSFPFPFPSLLYSMDLATHFFNASAAGRVAEVKKILEHPELDINSKDPRLPNNTALHFAANNGHHQVVKILLAHPRIDVNVSASLL